MRYIVSDTIGSSRLDLTLIYFIKLIVNIIRKGANNINNNLKVKQMETKRAKVIMLPNEKYIENYAVKHFNEGILIPVNNTHVGKIIEKRIQLQHLYIITDDDLNHHDWCIDIDTNELLLNKGSVLRVNRKKIIATIDILPDYKAGIDVGLFLPQPSKAFIEKYCELGGIDEILVEYEKSKVFGVAKDNSLLINIYLK